MIASSTIEPRATTKPARTMVLIVPPFMYSTSSAAISDSGIATQADQGHAPLVEEGDQHQNHEEGADQQRHGKVVDRGFDEGRRPEDLVVDLDIAEPRLHFGESRLNASRYVERIAQGSFSTMSIRPGPSLMTPSPISRGWSHDDAGHIPKADDVAALRLDRYLPEAFRRDRRADGRDVESLIGPLDESAWPESWQRSVSWRSPKSRASDVPSRTSCIVTPCVRIRSGSICTWSCFSRSPQIGTFATPGTRNRRHRIFQYVVIDRSSMDIVFDVKPIFMTRLVEDSGCSITAGPTPTGRRACA